MSITAADTSRIQLLQKATDFDTRTRAFAASPYADVATEQNDAFVSRLTRREGNETLAEMKSCAQKTARWSSLGGTVLGCAGRTLQFGTALAFVLGGPVAAVGAFVGGTVMHLAGTALKARGCEAAATRDGLENWERSINAAQTPAMVGVDAAPGPAAEVSKSDLLQRADKLDRDVRAAASYPYAAPLLSANSRFANQVADTSANTLGELQASARATAAGHTRNAMLLSLGGLAVAVGVTASVIALGTTAFLPLSLVGLMLAGASDRQGDKAAEARAFDQRLTAWEKAMAPAAQPVPTGGPTQPASPPQITAESPVQAPAH